MRSVYRVRVCWLVNGLVGHKVFGDQFIFSIFPWGSFVGQQEKFVFRIYVYILTMKTMKTYKIYAIRLLYWYNTSLERALFVWNSTVIMKNLTRPCWLNFKMLHLSIRAAKFAVTFLWNRGISLKIQAALKLHKTISLVTSVLYLW